MAVPADGIKRLIYFVDRRIGQLNLSKEEIARRGGPNRDTLAKIRDRTNARTPSVPHVETLLRFDEFLGWLPGSAATTLLGGRPASITAMGKPRRGRPPKEPPPLAVPVRAEEILRRLAGQLDDEIAHLEQTRDAVDKRIDTLRTLHDHFLAELAVDSDQVSVRQAAYKASTARQVAGRRRKPAAS